MNAKFTPAWMTLSQTPPMGNLARVVCPLQIRSIETAAHPTLPIPSCVRVRNPANSHEVVVRINDRGPFHGGRIIDLSYAAALKLGLLRVQAGPYADRVEAALITQRVRAAASLVPTIIERR